MQNSARCVLPVRSTSKCRNTRSTSHGGTSSQSSGICSNAIFNSYKRITAALVDTWRLTRRSNKATREQIRKRGVVDPIPDQTAEEVGTAQKGAVAGRPTAHDDVIATARSGVRSIAVKFLCSESG